MKNRYKKFSALNDFYSHQICCDSNQCKACIKLIDIKKNVLSKMISKFGDSFIKDEIEISEIQHDNEAESLVLFNQENQNIIQHYYLNTYPSPEKIKLVKSKNSLLALNVETVENFISPSGNNTKTPKILSELSLQKTSNFLDALFHSKKINSSVKDEESLKNDSELNRNKISLSCSTEIDSIKIMISSLATENLNSSSEMTNQCRPLKCEECKKFFNSSKSLARHKLTHSITKRYTCYFCQKGFNDAFDLKRHTRTHTGVKPYKCTFCTKAFTQRCSLEAHISRIHNLSLPFNFRERRPKLYICEVCGYTSDNLNYFKFHIKYKHNNKEAELFNLTKP